MKKRLPKFIAALALSFLAAAFFTYHFARQKVKNTGDLAAAEGQLFSYTFLDDSRGTHHYEIHLSGYSATFQIPAAFAKYFALARFESNLKKGDSLTIYIPAEDGGNLTSDAPISVFAARTKTATYLDEYNTLGAYNKAINNKNKLPTLLSSVFLSIGAAFAILWIGLAFKSWRAKRKFDTAEIIYESSQRMQKCLPIPMRAAGQKSATPSQSQPGEPAPTCPICGAPAEKAYLYADAPPSQPTAPEGDAATGVEGSQPYAEVLRCSSCKRIILEYGQPAEDAPQAAPAPAVATTGVSTNE